MPVCVASADTNRTPAPARMASWAEHCSAQECAAAAAKDVLPMAIAAPTQPFEHLLLDFLAYLEFERGLSRNTLEAYRSDLLQLGAHLRRTGTDALTVGHSDLAGFVADLAAGDEDRPPVAAATLQRKVACLRSFY